MKDLRLRNVRFLLLHGQDSPLPGLFPDVKEQIFVVKQRFDLQHTEQVLEPPPGLFSATAGQHSG